MKIHQRREGSELGCRQNTFVDEGCEEPALTRMYAPLATLRQLAFAPIEVASQPRLLTSGRSQLRANACW